MSDKKNTATIDIDDYYEMKIFHDKIKLGHHVSIVNQHGYKHVIYGNTEKISEGIIQKNNELIDKNDKLERDNRNLDMINAKLRSDKCHIKRELDNKTSWWQLTDTGTTIVISILLLVVIVQLIIIVNI